METVPCAGHSNKSFKSYFLSAEAVFSIALCNLLIKQTFFNL